MRIGLTGRKFADLSLMKNGLSELDLRKPVSVEKRLQVSHKSLDDSTSESDRLSANTTEVEVI
jgi:hypothetical protein